MARLHQVLRAPDSILSCYSVIPSVGHLVHRAVPAAVTPDRRKEEEKRGTASPFKDPYFLLNPIGQNVVTWPQLAVRQAGRGNGYSGCVPCAQISCDFGSKGKDVGGQTSDL